MLASSEVRRWCLGLLDRLMFVGSGSRAPSLPQPNRERIYFEQWSGMSTPYGAGDA